MPSQPAARIFLTLYSLHILTTAVLPVVLYALRIIDGLQTLVMIVAFAGFWTLVGVIFMRSSDSTQLRKFYVAFGILFVALATLVYLSSYF